MERSKKPTVKRAAPKKVVKQPKPTVEPVKIPEVNTPVQEPQIQTKERKKVQWKKLGASSYTTRDGQVVQSGETFYAYPEEIPMAFRDIIVPVIDV